MVAMRNDGREGGRQAEREVAVRQALYKLLAGRLS